MRSLLLYFLLEMYDLLIVSDKLSFLKFKIKTDLCNNSNIVHNFTNCL